MLTANLKSINNAHEYLNAEMAKAKQEREDARLTDHVDDDQQADAKIRRLEKNKEQLDAEKQLQLERTKQERSLRDEAAKRTAHITQDDPGTGANAGSGSPANPAKPGETLTMNDPIKGGELDTTNLTKIDGTNYYKGQNGETFFKGEDGKLYRTDNPDYQSQFGKPEQGTAAQLKGLKQYDPATQKWNEWTGGGEVANGQWSHGFGGTAGHPSTVWESGNGSTVGQSTKPFSSSTRTAFNNFGEGFTGKSGFSTPEYSSTQTGALRNAFPNQDDAASAARTNFGSWTGKYSVQHTGDAFNPSYRIIPRGISAASVGSNLSQQTVTLEIP